jgi:Mn-dependent DtxR family transcriptional regulator/methyl-accepting chemotaxis protein
VNVVIDRLPKCLHTCLQCRHAVIFEEYSGPSKRIFFDGCWKDNDVRRLMKREDCKKFEESKERISRKFWEKWEWKVYKGQHLSKEVSEEEESSKSCEDLFKRADEVYAEQVDSQENEIPMGSDAITDSIQVANTAVSTSEKTQGLTTRALVLQALTNNISRLKDIASFAGVDPSTAHYHMRNLMRDERVIKMAWGHYTLSDNVDGNSRIFLDNDGKTFEKLLKNFSQSGRGRTGSGNLDPVERNILMDILSKDNKYEQFSERELARRNKVSRYMVKKYTEKLEKNKLITINQVGNQYVYTPTELAIKGLSGFFDSVRNGSKIDSSSSKIQPINEPDLSKVQLSHEVQPADTEVPQTQIADQDISADPNPGNSFEIFDDYITWQQKNAHRLFIQFKLLQCNHNKLKSTGWIFGKKSIHKHFTEAYIFKSKDPTGEFINVLPKNPFIFGSPFEFESQILNFVNEVVERLRDYSIILDLSEPAAVKTAHVALENDLFARKVIKKGLLHFRTKVTTRDSTGELIEYVIAIDKSQEVHLEVEGQEAKHFTESYSDFIDDVVTGRIDRKFLRKLPEENKKIEKGITTIQETQDQFRKDLEYFSETTKFYSENIKTHVKAIDTLSQKVEQSTRTDSQIEESAAKIERAAHGLIEATELLQQLLERIASYPLFSRS